MSEVKLTSLDSQQIPRYSYDEDNRAVRVTVVNGTHDWKPQDYAPSIPATTVEKIEVPVIIKEVEYKTLEVPVIVRELEIKEVEKVIIVTEYKTIEVPVIIKETEYREIEKPTIITEYKIIEVPVLVKEKEIVYIDKMNYKMLFIIQAITLGLIVLSKFIKL